MKIKRISIAALMLVVMSTASADVVPVGEFAGEMWEGFENIGTPGSYSPLPIFEGNGSMIDSLANMAVIAYNWYGPAGEVLPYNGNYMGGTPAGSTLFDFSTPILAFGGQFNTVSDVADGTIKFFDVEGALLEELTYNVTPATWGWQGWVSDTPIGGIEVIKSGPFGNMPMEYDDLQVNFVPEPGAICLVAVGVGMLLRRRR